MRWLYMFYPLICYIFSNVNWPLHPRTKQTRSWCTIIYVHQWICFDYNLFGSFHKYLWIKFACTKLFVYLLQNNDGFLRQDHILFIFISLMLSKMSGTHIVLINGFPKCTIEHLYPNAEMHSQMDFQYSQL